MKGKSALKVPGGKLVKVEVEFSQNKIQQIKIMGDFFLHPEEGIKKIEESLPGKTLKKDLLAHTIQKTLNENTLQLIGVEPNDIAEAVVLAAQK
jgi:hypothetical protein